MRVNNAINKIDFFISSMILQPRMDRLGDVSFRQKKSELKLNMNSLTLTGLA